MLQGLAASVLKGEGEAACTPDAPRATKPTEATILFIVILSYSHPRAAIPTVMIARIFSQTASRCQSNLKLFAQPRAVPRPHRFQPSHRQKGLIDLSATPALIHLHTCSVKGSDN